VGRGPAVLRLFPTPEAKLGSSGPDYARATRPGTGGDSLHEAVGRLLPTPTSTDHEASGSAAYAKTSTHNLGTTLTDAAVRQPGRWGQYAEAIARWEPLTRPAPDPTEPTGRNGAHRLSPRFVEWMQGLPAGHVTDVPDVTWSEQLKALGNGVVPQQCAAAVWHLLEVRNAHLPEAVAA